MLIPNSMQAPLIRDVAVTLRIVGIAYFSMTSGIEHVFLKTSLTSYGLMKHCSRGNSNLDGEDIMANNQNPGSENEWYFYLRNCTVKLYVHARV